LKPENHLYPFPWIY
jgi:hypothetical protein